MSHSELALTWDELLNRSRDNADLSERERRDAVQAFTELKDVFEDRFFTIQHPLFAFFFDRSAWRCEWAIWFANFLRTIKQHPDFLALIRDLRDPSKYSERMTILNIVELLLWARFSFSLDKAVTINCVEKKPDLFVQLDAGDPGFFIEVSSLSSSQKQREADDVFHAVTDVLFHYIHLLDYSGYMERSLDSSELGEVLQKVQAAAEKVVSDSGFETLDITEVIQLALAAKSEKEALKNWATAYGIEPCEFSGPPDNAQEIARIFRKLKEENKQVPPDRTNVVVIYSHLFSTPPRDLRSFEQFVDCLEDKLLNHSHIGYLVLLFNWIGGNNDGVLHCRDHINNRLAARPMPPLVEERFRNAFVRAGSSTFSQSPNHLQSP
jgi:hypothetical protein